LPIKTNSAPFEFRMRLHAIFYLYSEIRCSAQ